MRARASLYCYFGEIYGLPRSFICQSCSLLDSAAAAVCSFHLPPSLHTFCPPPALVCFSHHSIFLVLFLTPLSSLLICTCRGSHVLIADITTPSASIGTLSASRKPLALFASQGSDFLLSSFYLLTSVCRIGVRVPLCCR